MTDERAALIRDICATLDAHNRSRPWAAELLWCDAVARGMESVARAWLASPPVQRLHESLGQLSDALVAAGIITPYAPFAPRHRGYRRAVRRSRYAR